MTYAPGKVAKSFSVSKGNESVFFDQLRTDMDLTASEIEKKTSQMGLSVREKRTFTWFKEAWNKNCGRMCFGENVNFVEREVHECPAEYEDLTTIEASLTMFDYVPALIQRQTTSLLLQVALGHDLKGTHSPFGAVPLEVVRSIASRVWEAPYETIPLDNQDTPDDGGFVNLGGASSADPIVIGDDTDTETDTDNVLIYLNLDKE